MRVRVAHFVGGLLTNPEVVFASHKSKKFRAIKAILAELSYDPVVIVIAVCVIKHLQGADWVVVG